MTETNTIIKNRINNIRQLRVFLRMNQKRFLENCCADEEGNLKISVATLSNIESKGGAAMEIVINGAAEAFGLEPELFDEEPLAFLQTIDRHFSELERNEVLASTEKEDSITALVNKLTEYYADMMFDGEIKRGDKIEPDRVLAEKFNVGRSALREAMKVLHVMGLVDIRPGQGTFISNRESNFFEIPLLWSLFLSNSQVDQILMLRNLLEGQAAAQAATGINDSIKEKLARILDDSLKAYNALDEKTLLELDVEFHTAIAECSGNHLIYAQIRTIRNLLKRVSRSGMDGEDTLRQIYEEHKEIYDFICEGKKTEAQASMHKHINNSRERYRID